MSVSVKESPQRRGTFVTVGGSMSGFSGMPRLLKVVSEIQEVLPQPILVQAAASRVTVPLTASVRDFVPQEEFKEEIKESKVVIGHSGCGFFLTANSFGKVPIVMPRVRRFGEHIDDHQESLARKLESLDVADVIYPHHTSSDVVKIVSKNIARGPAKKLVIEQPDFSSLGEATIAVAGVGGHRTQLQHYLRHYLGRVTFIVDDWCHEVKRDLVVQFPCCHRRFLFPRRVLQALRVLQRFPGHSVVTTGPSVGAAFLIAAKLLGRQSVAIETLTRIDYPSLWFRAALQFASVCYVPSWASWGKAKLRNVRFLSVDMV